jgi:Fe-S cluster biogenesis protein NfuA
VAFGLFGCQKVALGDTLPGFFTPQTDFLYLCGMTIDQKTDLLSRVESALETVRPHLRVDKGDIELVDVTDDLVVQIRWVGMCESCSMSAMTLRAGVAEAIRNKIPEIARVEAVNGVPYQPAL